MDWESASTSRVHEVSSHPPSLVLIGYVSSPEQSPTSAFQARTESNSSSQIAQSSSTSLGTQSSTEKLYDDVPFKSLEALQSTLDGFTSLSLSVDLPSVTAFLDAIASAAAQASRTLYTFADSRFNGNTEFESTALEVDTSLGIFEDLRDTLEDATETATPTALEDVDKILVHCRDVFETILHVLSRYRATDRTNFRSTAQWAFQREIVKPVRVRLEALKTTLLVWLGVMKLAMHKSESSST